MKKPFLIALALAAAPFAAQAETINLYGWQNHSWEFVDENGKNYDRIQSNAGNIGFAASVDTGMDGITVNLQCEQFTYYNHFSGGTGWCNRNSKIGLKHPQAGEIMLATWLLPYNEGVAQWVDPFYDAGADSHTSIMGSVGAHTIFYNTGDFDQQASASNPSTGFSGAEFNYAGGGYDTGFNRRQENIIQYWSPNWNGFVFRFAWTAGKRDESDSPRRMMKDGKCISHCGEIDPVIRSSSLAYTNGPLWLAVTWQDHEDWSAASVGQMDSSDAESFRLAGRRYIMDMGDGVSVQISAMWEDLEYEFNDVSSFDKVMGAFGFPNAGTYGLNYSYDELAVVKDTSGAATGVTSGKTALIDDHVDGTADAMASPFADVYKNAAARKYSTKTFSADGTEVMADVFADGDIDTAAEVVAILNYDDNATEAQKRQQKALMEAIADVNKERDASARGMAGAGQNVKVERDAWMVSGKVKFGGPVDFRFSYMDADDLEVSCGACMGDWQDTAADAWNVGLFYTMPAGTELRLTYSEVDNDKNGSYGQGISGSGLGAKGSEVEMFALGIVHWFD